MGKSVIAFEPIYRNVRYLCQNIKKNGWSNVEIYPIALSGGTGVLEIYGGNTGASVVKGWSGIPENYVTLVPSSTMDVVISDRLLGKKTLIIVDIEGAERMMLTGATKMFANKPKPIWMIEIVNDNQNSHEEGIKSNFESIFELFFQNGYQAITVDKDMRPITAEDIDLISKGKLKIDTYNFLFREIRK
jgi:FkbM family methyltransferase